MSAQTASRFNVLSSRDHLVEGIKQIVSEISGTPLDQIDETKTLLRDLSLDSLDLIECSMEIEEEYDISVPEELMDNANTVKDLADELEKLLKKSSNDD